MTMNRQEAVVWIVATILIVALWCVLHLAFCNAPEFVPNPRLQLYSR